MGRKRFHEHNHFRDIVLERDGYKCAWCERTLDLHIDHIIPVSKGGQNTLDNMQILCSTCNHLKANYIITRDEGLALIKEHKRWVDRRNMITDIYGSIEERNRLTTILRKLGIKNRFASSAIPKPDTQGPNSTSAWVLTRDGWMPREFIE